MMTQFDVSDENCRLYSFEQNCFFCFVFPSTSRSVAEMFLILKRCDDLILQALHYKLLRLYRFPNLRCIGWPCHVAACTEQQSLCECAGDSELLPRVFLTLHAVCSHHSSGDTLCNKGAFTGASHGALCAPVLHAPHG